MLHICPTTSCARNMPTSSKNERTRAGCWTCRARRKKCDETRPQCNQCSKLGLQCEGYGVRLKWGKTRVRMPQTNNAQMTKVPSELSKHVLGDTATVPDEALVYYLGEELYHFLSPVEREIMQSCKCDHEFQCNQLKLIKHSRELGCSYPHLTSEDPRREVFRSLRWVEITPMDLSCVSSHT
jgi:hypothetical protein